VKSFLTGYFAYTKPQAAAIPGSLSPELSAPPQLMNILGKDDATPPRGKNFHHNAGANEASQEMKNGHVGSI
jgi:hypothetical protein